MKLRSQLGDSQRLNGRRESMLVDAIYDNGRVLFDRRYVFAHKRFSVKLEVPESEITGDIIEKSVTTTSKISKARSLQSEMETICKISFAAADAAEDHLTEKQQQHWDSSTSYGRLP
jgi:hypothetical protein